MLNTLLFTIYNFRDHFEHKNLTQAESERFLDALKDLSDNPLFIAKGKAISKDYQKLYSILGFHSQLLSILNSLIRMKSLGFLSNEEGSACFLIALRKILIILIIFVHKNEQNQKLLSDNRDLILNYCDESFFEISCNSVILFAELLRDNEELSTLNKIHVYQITLRRIIWPLKQSSLISGDYYYGAACLLALPIIHQLHLIPDDFVCIPQIQTHLECLYKNLNKFDSMNPVGNYKRSEPQVESIVDKSLILYI